MIKAPVILGFDTASGHCAVSIVQGERILAETVEDMRKGQAERLMGIVTQTLNDASVTLDQLEGIGVGVGPGNFTGIRIAVSAARGLALGLGVPSIGISAFDALQLGFTGSCTTTVDARQNQIYVQDFEDNGAGTAPRLVGLDQFAARYPVIGVGGMSAKYPVAVAIALLAAKRLEGPQARPAPLYIRPADAAPARDAPPKILS
ncbi:MAG: tRNA (adenosine(37)-N6)-threonylcarbamoyltransferase complex dimerization subunit type 1 TsaB [Roseobacter sp.]